MTDFLDANVICRYLVGEPAELADRAARLIDSDRPLRISLLILAEAAHVLRSVYGHDRESVAEALVQLLQRENIEAHEVETDWVVEALGLCRPSGRVSFPDALLWATARASSPSRVWSFDRRFPSGAIELREP